MSQAYWTHERIAELTDLWKQGLSASTIAVRMGSISRNAVIGKAHRLMLPKHPEYASKTITHERKPEPVKAAPVAKAAKVKPLVRPSRAPRASLEASRHAYREAMERMENPPAPRDDVMPMPEPLNLSLVDLLHNSCRFPVSGTGASTLFCGHPNDGGTSYCPCHHKLTHGPGSRAERRVDELLRKVA